MNLQYSNYEQLRIVQDTIYSLVLLSSIVLYLPRQKLGVQFHRVQLEIV